MAFSTSKDLNITSISVKNNLRLPLVNDITSFPIQSVGSLVYNESDDKIYYSDGLIWIVSDGSFPAVTLSTVGSGSSIVNDSIGPTLAVKSLSTSGSGLSILSTATDIIISNDSPASNITLTDAGTLVHESLLSSTTSPNFSTKGLVAGSNISLSSTLTDITINAIIPPQTIVTLMSAGGIHSLAGLGVFPNLTVKGLNAGPGIVMSNIGTTSVTISAPNAVPTSLVSVGGFPLVVNGTGPNLTMKGLLGDTGMIDIISNTTDLTLTLTGGVISLSDIGVDPLHVSIAGPSVGNSLRTKGVVPGVGIIITETVTDITISSITPESISLEAGPGIAIGGTPETPLIINLNPDIPSLFNLSPGSVSLVPGGIYVGPAMQVKGLIAGIGIALTDGGSDVIISSSDGSITFTSSGQAPGNVSLIGSNSLNPNFAVKALVAGTGISLSSTGTDVTINSTIPSSITSAGGSFSLVNNGPSFILKGLTPGSSNITIVDNGTFLTIDSPSPTQGFHAYWAADTVILANTDIGGNWTTVGNGGWNDGGFNNVTGVYTLSATGIYTISFQISNNVSNNTGGLYINGASAYIAGSNMAPDFAESCPGGSMTLSLASGNTLSIRLRIISTVRLTAANQVGAQYGTWFSAVRIR